MQKFSQCKEQFWQLRKQTNLYINSSMNQRPFATQFCDKTRVEKSLLPFFYRSICDALQGARINHRAFFFFFSFLFPSLTSNLRLELSLTFNLISFLSVIENCWFFFFDLLSYLVFALETIFAVSKLFFHLMFDIWRVATGFHDWV